MGFSMFNTIVGCVMYPVNLLEFRLLKCLDNHLQIRSSISAWIVSLGTQDMNSGNDQVVNTLLQSPDCVCESLPQIMYITCWSNPAQFAIFTLPTFSCLTCLLSACNLTHWGRGHLNCLNARSRGLNNINQLLYCVSLKIYDKFANYFCELKFSGNTHQRP